MIFAASLPSNTPRLAPFTYEVLKDMQSDRHAVCCCAACTWMLTETI